MKPKTQPRSANLEAKVEARTRELQHSHEQTHQLNRKLRTIGACNRILMRAVEESALLNDICRLVCDQAAYRLAWVGYAVNDAARTVRLEAHAGDDGGFLAAAPLSWEDSEQGRSPTGCAIRTGLTCGIGDFSTDRSAPPWSRQALACGFRSGLALPLKDEGNRVFGALTIFSTEPAAFTPEETGFLEELAGDLAFGLTVLRDRHEHRRAEEELRRSERGLSEAQRLMHLGNWELDLVHNVLTWSDEIYRIFEIDREKFAASYEAFLSAIHPEDRDRVNRAYTDSLKHKAPYEIAHRLLMPDGRIKHVSERCETYYDETGRPVRSVGTVHDITERKLAEAALHESEERYRTLIQKLQTAVVVHAEDTRILTCNPIAQSLLGLTEDQLLGKTALDPAWHFFREDGTPMPPEEYPVARVRATRQPVRNQVLGVHRPDSATDLWAMVNANPVFGPDGRITEIIVAFIDITERKQAQERLDHLAAIVDSTDDAIIGKTLDARILSWNHGAERIYGYIAAEIVGRSISTLLSPGRQPELDRIMAGLKNGERIEHLETERVRRDGQIIQVALTISPIRNARGQIVGASTIARDITGRKQAESALRRYAEEVQDLYDHAPCGYHSLAEDGTFLRINDTELAWLGYTREEVLGKMKFADVLTPPSRAVFEQGFPGYKNRGWVRDVDFELVRKNGTTFPVLLNSTAIKDAKDRFIMGRSVLHDITERKHTEAINAARLHLMQFATSHSSDELLEATLDEAEKLTGSRIGFYHFVDDDQQSLNLQNWSTQTKAEFCRAEGKGRHYPIDQAGVWVDCIRQRGPVIHNDYASLPHRKGLPPGHAAVIRELVVPVLRGDKIRAILGVGNKPADYTEENVKTVSLLADLAWEIAERKRAEERVLQLNTELEHRVEARTRQLQEANRELVEFSYSMSHDLRTPLRSIDGFSQALLEDYAGQLDDAGKEHLQTVRAASQRMGQVLDAMVALLRLNRSEMHIATVNLSELAAQVAASLQKMEPGRDAVFVIAPGCEALGDAGLLKVALESLLDNAWKYTGRTHPAKIEFGRTQMEGAPAYFVRDNGEGFDMQYAGNLFGAFQRLHSSGEFPGTGVGLAYVQRIIRRHGGRVWAEGRPGHGATFYFALPDPSHATP